MRATRSSKRIQAKNATKANGRKNRAAALRRIRAAKEKKKKSSSTSSKGTPKGTTATTTILRNPYAKKPSSLQKKPPPKDPPSKDPPPSKNPPSPVSEDEDPGYLSAASLSIASLSIASELNLSSDEEESAYEQEEEELLDDASAPTTTKKRRLNAPANHPSRPSANRPSTKANHPAKANPSATSFLPDFDYTPTAAAAIPRIVPNKEDGTVDFSTVDLNPKESGTTTTTTDPSGFSIASILQSIHENPIKVGPDAVQVTIDNLHTNTHAHVKKVLTAERDFFEVLANHATAYALAEKIPDPEDPSVLKFRLYIECRAPPAPRKHKLLNYALMLYSVSHRKKKYRGMDLSKSTALFAEAQYEPNTVDLFFKCLFSRFHSESIPYRLSKDFNGQGMCYSQSVAAPHLSGLSSL